MRIFKLTKVSTQLSLAAFVATGLTGCSQSDCDDQKNLLPQSKIDECKKNKTFSGVETRSSTSSGFFMPYSSSPKLTSSGGQRKKIYLT